MSISIPSKFFPSYGAFGKIKADSGGCTEVWLTTTFVVAKKCVCHGPRKNYWFNNVAYFGCNKNTQHFIVFLKKKNIFVCY